MNSLPLQHPKEGWSPLTNLPLLSVQWLQWLAHCIVTKTATVLSSVDAICIYIGLSSVYMCNMHILAICDVPTMLLLLAAWLCWTSVQHAFMFCVMARLLPLAQLTACVVHMWVFFGVKRWCCTQSRAYNCSMFCMCTCSGSPQRVLHSSSQ